MGRQEQMYFRRKDFNVKYAMLYSMPLQRLAQTPWLRRSCNNANRLVLVRLQRRAPSVLGMSCIVPRFSVRTRWNNPAPPSRLAEAAGRNSAIPYPSHTLSTSQTTGSHSPHTQIVPRVFPYSMVKRMVVPSLPYATPCT